MKSRALFAAVVAIYLFLLAPLLIVVAVSFDPTDAFRFPPPGVSLRWYAAFFTSDTFVRAFFRVRPSDVAAPALVRLDSTNGPSTGAD